MKLKNVIPFMLLIFCPVGTWAQNAASYVKVLVWSTDKDYTVFLCADHPVVTRDAQSLYIKSKTAELVFPATDVRKFTFSTDVSAVKSVTSNQGKFLITQEMLEVSNLKAGTSVLVYTIDGKSVANSRADSEGNAKVSLSGVVSGTYVVKMGNVNFKFLKK